MTDNRSGPAAVRTADEARGFDQATSEIIPENTDLAIRNQDELQFHPLADLFPLMQGEEFIALIADIDAHGQREPIILHEGMILDGCNRYRACREIGLQPWITGFDLVASTNDNAEAYVISANIRRRHLTANQKREVIGKLLVAKPEASNVSIAKIANVDDKTVAAVRRDKEATSEIPRLEKRVGADGKARKQPTPNKRRERVRKLDGLESLAAAKETQRRHQA